MQPSPPRRIIVFCLPGIGDAVLFTPALGLLRRSFPEAHITVMTMFRGSADILATNPDLTEVRHFDFFNAPARESLCCLWQLWRERYDLSIMSFPSNRFEYNCVNWFIGRRWRAAHRYDHQSWRNLWFLNNIVAREDGHRHNVEENLHLIRTIVARIGVPATAPEPSADRAACIRQLPLKLVLPDEDRTYGNAFLAERGVGPDTLLFGFHTWSSTYKNMTRKCWDKDNFVALIQRLGSAHPAARFLIFSGPADEAVNQYIMQHVDGRVLLVREPNLRHALAILRHCRVFISNDSAVMHLAAALGVPVVALFGPTNWNRLHPWSDNYTVIHKSLPCMPCFYYSSRPLRCVAGIDYACLREISVDEVFVAVQNQLHANPIAAPR
jgi:ADP-heptose:LPS heptosyltransferase